MVKYKEHELHKHNIVFEVPNGHRYTKHWLYFFTHVFLESSVVPLEFRKYEHLGERRVVLKTETALPHFLRTSSSEETSAMLVAAKNNGIFHNGFHNLFGGVILWQVQHPRMMPPLVFTEDDSFLGLVAKRRFARRFEMPNLTASEYEEMVQVCSSENHEEDKVKRKTLKDAGVPEPYITPLKLSEESATERAREPPQPLKMPKLIGEILADSRAGTVRGKRAKAEKPAQNPAPPPSYVSLYSTK